MSISTTSTRSWGSWAEVNRLDCTSFASGPSGLSPRTGTAPWSIWLRGLFAAQRGWCTGPSRSRTNVRSMMAVSIRLMKAGPRPRARRGSDGPGIASGRCAGQSSGGFCGTSRGFLLAGASPSAIMAIAAAALGRRGARQHQVAGRTMLRIGWRARVD